MSEEHAPAPAAEKASPRIHTITLDESAWKLLFHAAKPGELPEQTLARVLEDRMKKKVR